MQTKKSVEQTLNQVDYDMLDVRRMPKEKLDAMMELCKSIHSWEGADVYIRELTEKYMQQVTLELEIRFSTVCI